MTNKLGNARWREFAQSLPDVHYETLRKAVTEERRPSPHLMERCAAALSLEPMVFVEYRIWAAQRSVDPEIVGEDRALRALEAWEPAKAELSGGDASNS